MVKRKPNAEADDAHHKWLAAKVISGERLTTEEKECIYKILVGEPPPTRKVGRPNQTKRNKEIAEKYIRLLPNKRVSTSLRKDIAKEYCIFTDGKYKDNTMCSVIRTGVIILENEVSRRIIRLRSRFSDDPTFEERLKDYQEILSLINIYRRRHKYKNI